MTRCPSELKLELFLLEGESSSHAAHVGSCQRCQRRVEEMRALGREFHREVLPATEDAILEAAEPRRWFQRWIYLAPVPIAVAAAVVLFLATQGREEEHEDYVGLKGDALTIAAFVRVGDESRALADGEAVPASSALRFLVHPIQPCRLWLVSVDASGQVSRLYPTHGEGGAVVSGSGALPGGVVLDGQSGPERFFAVCAREPIPFADVERAVRAAAPGGEQAVRSARRLSGLPPGVDAATLLVERRP